MRLHVAAFALLGLVPVLAAAEVKQASADSLLVQNQRTLRASPAGVYAALAEIGQWWSSEHTRSGQAAHLSLAPTAGGCFCERWDGQSVEHGRVIWASPARMLRLDSALGPLQALAVKGVMSFELAPGDGGTVLQFEYRVSGTAGSGLDRLAPAVDAMLMAQLDRLQHYVERGKAGG